jgi:ABC-type glycerol-3-phosphate transport system permease component
MLLLTSVANAVNNNARHRLVAGMILSAFFISLAVTVFLILLGLSFSEFNGFAGHVARIEVELARRLFAGFLLVRILIHENSLVCAKATQRELIS